jgi:hypothetical protein
MGKRILAVVAAAILLAFVGLIALTATAEVTQSGTASGVQYSFSSGGFRNTSFTPSPTGFQFISSSWFGTSKLDITCNAGRLSVNGRPASTVRQGDYLSVSSDQRVLLNGAPLP